MNVLWDGMVMSIEFKTDLFIPWIIDSFTELLSKEEIEGTYAWGGGAKAAASLCLVAGWRGAAKGAVVRGLGPGNFYQHQ